MSRARAEEPRLSPAQADTQFRLVSDFEPRGDQPRAIEELTAGLLRGDKHQVLLGVTGSGKTFTMASVIATVNRPTLVLAHNKTLAAQLYQEFKSFFPDNAVEYFVSYYDYYQPEAYVPQSDTYIEKESTINDEIDRLRLSATRSLFERRDVVIVASVSCIYGLGSPEAYYGMLLFVRQGDTLDRRDLLAKLVDARYDRNDYELRRGTFRVRGDVVEIVPAYEESGIRIELFGDEVERISSFDPLTGKTIGRLAQVAIYPSSHYVTPQPKLADAVRTIEAELLEEKARLEGQGKLLEAQRLFQRTMFDLEMLRETGHCHGIENYSRHLSGRRPGDPPPTLLDYLPKDALMVIDESHQSVPQVRGMYAGDRQRKKTLVEYGFRLPSALDNRPLNFDEFEARVGQVVYVSATPGPVRAAEGRRRRGRAGHPPDRADGPAGRGAAGEGPGRRSAGRDPRPCRSAASACSSPPSPSAWPRTSPSTTTSSACACAICTPTSRRSSVCGSCAICARASSTCWWASTCCARASTCRRCRWSPSSTRTRKASCARGLADPDHGPRGAQPGGHGDPLRRQAHRLDEQRARGDGPPACHPGGLQPRPRHHAREHPQEHRGAALVRLRARYVAVPAVEEESAERYRSLDDIEAEVKSLEKQMREAAKALEFEKAAELRDRLKKLRAREFGLK